MVAHEEPGAVLVVARIGALVHVVLAAALLVDHARFLRIRERMTGRVPHVVDPLAVRQEPVRLEVVRLPQRASVGGEGKAAELDSVPQEISMTIPWGKIAQGAGAVIVFAAASSLLVSWLGPEPSNTHVIEEWNATISKLGIDPGKQLVTPDGRPIEILDQGETIKELF